MTDIQLQIRSLVPKLTYLLMERYGWDMKKSLDKLYSSKTFLQICDPLCGLYYQGAIYNFTILQEEIEQEL